MKLTLRNEAQRNVSVEVHLKFFDSDSWWTAQPEPMKEWNGVVHVAIPGRKAEEIEKIVMEYDGMKIDIKPPIGEDGEMLPIAVYDSDKDYWTNVLRQMARGAVYIGESND